ncbi:acyl-CoA synthetase (AMP-forming)/AMP-acid ligase II [Mycobacterium sp. JS623]|uniref:FadD7 family fatty acid--CoA ligase n=1 Tax=Mycobacterium sp. JS623 TaxID=212767 RepID=UPI0002A5A268|nr:FadD7 family fatty acid--CoA ligase [Mycobacterium sp. JS623]AGB23896.1 acyl-CoA synthetase (AMP-forming)/AMP-acid ligase II [Mycobacterium sp. JS623]
MRIGGSDTALWRLGHILDGFAESQPGATALIVGPDRQRVSYAGLVRMVTDFSAALHRRGLRTGDVAALQCMNGIEFVVALLGAARAGLVVAPLDPALPSTEGRTRANRVGARVTLTDIPPPHPGGENDAPLWGLHVAPPAAQGTRSEIHILTGDSARTAPAVPGLAERDALIMFTSGTTGVPKLVPWTHDNLAAAIEAIGDAYQLSPSDATVAVMPLFHGHGLIAALLATLATGGMVALPAKGKFSAHTFADDAASADPTWYTAVPTIHQIILERAQPGRARVWTHRLRFIRSCSAPLSPALVSRLETAFDVPVLAAYGMTEATHQACTVLPSADLLTRTHTVGAPTGLSVRVVDDHESSCVTGATGEIWLRGAGVVRGYLENPDATAKSFVDGWVRTGDLGSLDVQGNLTIRGRIKELINRGGEKISPEHVEEVLVSYPGVASAAVFGVADELYGERVAALVVPRPGRHVDSADLVAYSRERLSAFEIPELITITDTLPLTAKGSIDRAKLAVPAANR